MDFIEAQKQLRLIRDEMKENAVEYKLSEDEIRYTNIVLNTLDYIVDALIKNAPLYCKLFFFEGETEKTHAPIHFEEYALKEQKNENELMGDISKQNLFNALIKPFIASYKTVKVKKKVKEFCSRLNGYCIDARTRKAFDYALADQDSPTFTDLLEKCIQSLPTNNKHLYFHAFAEILKTAWGQPFNIDEGRNGICKKPGVINTDQFDIIKQSLETLGYEHADDFLTAYHVIKEEQHQHLLPIFIKFVLSHKGFLNEMGLTKQGVIEESKEVKKAATPIVRELYNKMIIDLIPVMSKTIKDNPKNYGLDRNEFALFMDFLERASPATCFRILSVIPIHERPEERRMVYTKLLYLKLIWSHSQKNSGEYRDLLKIKFGGKYDLVGLLELCQRKAEPGIIRSLSHEEKASIPDNKSKPIFIDNKGKEAFVKAIIDLDLTLAGKMIEEGKISKQTAGRLLSNFMLNRPEYTEIITDFCASTLETNGTSSQSKVLAKLDSNLQTLTLDHNLYFFALVDIMKKSWCKEISLDGKKITVNSDQASFLMEYLNKKGYVPQNDFLTAYTGLKENHLYLLPIYIKFVLLHKGLLDSEGFTKLGLETPESLKEYKRIATPSERQLYNTMIEDLIPVMMRAIKEKSKQAELSDDDFKLFSDLISRTTPWTCFKILSVIPIHKRPPQKQVELITLLFMKFKYFREETGEKSEEFLKMKFGEAGDRYTLLDLTTMCKLPTIFEDIVKLVPKYKEIDGCITPPVQPIVVNVSSLPQGLLYHQESEPVKVESKEMQNRLTNS